MKNHSVNDIIRDRAADKYCEEHCGEESDEPLRRTCRRLDMPCLEGLEEHLAHIFGVSRKDAEIIALLALNTRMRTAINTAVHLFELARAVDYYGPEEISTEAESIFEYLKKEHSETAPK